MSKASKDWKKVVSMRELLSSASLLLTLVSLGAPARAIQEYEGCTAVPAMIPAVDEQQLRDFESCDEKGPPAHYNFCCSGFPDCWPGHCCGCSVGKKLPGEQPDGSFRRSAGLDCDTGLIRSHVNFRGVVTTVEWPETTRTRPFTDLPDTSFWDRDLTFNAMPADEDSRAMVVRANLRSRGGMHAEIPYDWVPGALFYLAGGDRVDLFGDWVEDCGHSPKIAEVHPVYGMAVSRLLHCPGREQTLGQVFYMAYGPTGDAEAVLRVYAPPRPATAQATLHFSEFLLIEKEVASKQLSIAPDAAEPYVEVRVKTYKRAGKAPGHCVSDDPSWTYGVRELALSYHALLAVWWEGGFTDLVPTLTDACHDIPFTVRNAGDVAAPETTALVIGSAGSEVVSVPALDPGQAVQLHAANGPRLVDCNTEVTVIVDPDRRVPYERSYNNMVAAPCVC